MHSILVIGKCDIFRCGLLSLIRRNRHWAECREASTLDEAEQYIAQMPGRKVVAFDQDDFSVGVAKEFTIKFPDCDLIIFAADFTRQAVFLALTSGAKAVLPRSVEASLVQSAINNILAGRTFVPVEYLTQGDSTIANENFVDHDESRFERLTERQRETIALLSQGKSNKEIGRSLHISENTVKIHMSAAFRQLGVTNRLAALAVLQGRGGAGLLADPSLIALKRMLTVGSIDQMHSGQLAIIK